MFIPNVLRNNDEPIRTQTDNHRKAMVFLRVFSSLGTAGGIYVCGGFNGTSSTPRAEFLDLQVASRTKGLGWRKLDLIRGAQTAKESKTDALDSPFSSLCGGAFGQSPCPL